MLGGDEHQIELNQNDLRSFTRVLGEDGALDRHYIIPEYTYLVHTPHVQLPPLTVQRIPTPPSTKSTTAAAPSLPYPFYPTPPALMTTLALSRNVFGRSLQVSHSFYALARKERNYAESVRIYSKIKHLMKFIVILEKFYVNSSYLCLPRCDNL